MKEPDKLRLVDGQLICVDGSDVVEYLRQWAGGTHVGPDTPINLIRKDVLERLRDDAWMYRNLAA